MISHKDLLDRETVLISHVRLDLYCSCISSSLKQNSTKHKTQPRYIIYTTEGTGNNLQRESFIFVL